MKVIRFIGVEQTGGCGMERHQVIEIITLLKNSSGSSINQSQAFSLRLSFFLSPFLLLLNEINWIARSPAVFWFCPEMNYILLPPLLINQIAISSISVRGETVFLSARAAKSSPMKIDISRRDAFMYLCQAK
jgi:hypothetical protein